ncbi:MAG TPA: ABC transporter permease, partial [Luteitalea sp.]|nr:ABC transporter permease [Luteitalea sp.]
MRRLFLKLLRRRQLERDLEHEMAFHREMAAQHGNAIPFGNPLVVKEQARDLWRFAAVENLWRDLRYAARGLRRSPGLVCGALLSLGLGLGVNTAIFSLVTDVLLSTPSIAAPDEWMALRLGGNSHSRPDIVEALRVSGVFRDVVGEREESSLNWDTGTETRPVYSLETTRNYFGGLGVPMAAGRGYTADDSRDVVVVSHRFWREHLDGRAEAIGRTLRLDGRAYTVVGVLPRRHRTLIGMGFSPDFYVPQFRPTSSLATYARVAPGTSVEATRSRAEAFGAQLDREGRSGGPFARDVRATPVGGPGRIKASNSKALMLFSVVLMAVVGLVLLIACVNVAGLLLARAAGRRDEMAVRLALGASRGRLLQQLLAESLLLSALGLVCGLAVRQGLAVLMERVTLPFPVPIRFQLELDGRVLVYSVVLMFVASMLAGILPAWQATRESLATGSRRATGRLRLRRAMVVAQVAVAFVVLSASALFLRNVLAAGQIDPGFDAARAVRADVHLPPAAYADRARADLFVDEALRALQATSGVEAAGAARLLPFVGGSNSTYRARLDGSDALVDMPVHTNAVSPGYFAAMRMPFVDGATFTPGGDSGARPVIVNREWTRRFSPDRTAVGRTFQLEGQPHVYAVVGVVEGTRNRSLGEDPAPQLFERLEDLGVEGARVQFVARFTRTPDAAAVDVVRAGLRAVEPTAGVVAEPLDA